VFGHLFNFPGEAYAKWVKRVFYPERNQRSLYHFRWFLGVLHFRKHSFFDNYATRNGSLPHYLFAIMLWSIMCMAIHMGVNRLDFSAQPPFTLHIWIGVLIYLIRVVATELCVVFEKIY
jgi:hypothetical protein